MEAEQYFCTFLLQGLWFAVPVENAIEVVRPPAITPLPGAPRGVLGLMNLRGQVLPVMDLRPVLQLSADASLPTAVVVGGKQGPVAVLVSEVGEVEKIDRSQLVATPVSLSAELRRIVTAVAVMPDRLLHRLEAAALVGPAAGLSSQPLPPPMIAEENQHASRSGMPASGDMGGAAPPDALP